MGFLKRLFRTSDLPIAPQEAVLIYLDGACVPAADDDLAELEDALIDAIERAGAGEFDGNAIGPSETILFMYGPDAERLFAVIAPILRRSPMCANARVVVRRGGLGAAERELRV